MSNILSTQNTNVNNEIPARKLEAKSNFGKYIEAPQSLPKYSIDKVLQEKDEFRRNIVQTQNETLYKKKSNNGLLKLGIVLAAVGSFFLLKGKKSIK